MNVLTVSRPCWLAAVVMALFGAGCAEAVADDQPLGGPAPAAVAGDPAAVEGQVALLAEEKEGEAREREARQREEAELREREARQREEAAAREREGGERREAEAGRARLAQELGQLEEKARDIRRKLEGLRDGQDAEAKELQGALREVEEKMVAIRRELRGPEGEGERRELGERERAELQGRLRTLEEKRRALSDQAAVIQHSLEGLRRDDQAEQARKLRATLDELRAAAERVGGEMRELQQRLGRPREGADQPRPDREQLVKRLAELKALVGRLAAAGKRDEAAAKEREVHEIIRLLERRPDAPPPGVPEELQRRIGHLKVAIDNLRAAGLNEQAQQLVQQVDRLIEEHRGLTGRPPEPPRPPEPRERPVPPELGERLEQQGQAIRELNAAMNELRQQMAQLREMVQRLVPREGEELR